KRCVLLLHPLRSNLIEHLLCLRWLPWIPGRASGIRGRSSSGGRAARDFGLTLAKIRIVLFQPCGFLVGLGSRVHLFFRGESGSRCLICWFPSLRLLRFLEHVTQQKETQDTENDEERLFAF